MPQDLFRGLSVRQGAVRGGNGYREVIACNCSRCGRLGMLMTFAPASQFKLLSRRGLT